MKYIVTIVENIRVSEMIEAEDEQDAFNKLKEYDFQSIASHETRTKHVEIRPSDSAVVEVEGDDGDTTIQTMN